MSLNQKKYNYIILIILITFFVKGVFLSTILPIFKGQDESRHYNTIQFLNEPKEKTWEMTSQTDSDQDKEYLSTYRFSEEIRNTALKTETHRLRYNKLDTITFTNSFEGKNEKEIKENNLPAINKIKPVDKTRSEFYHKLSYLIENTFENKNIFVRFYLIRVFSVFLVTLSIFFSYLALREIEIPQKNLSLLLVLAIFQPGLSLYATNINYDSLLILSFSAFIYGGILYLKQGLNKKTALLLILATIIGILTKGTAIVLLIILAGILLFEFFKITRKHSKKAGYLSAILSIVVLFSILIVNSKYLPLNDKSIPEVITSMNVYSAETLNMKRFTHTAKTYWGIDELASGTTVDILKYTFLVIDLLSFLGFLLYYFSRKKLPKYLPAKKYSLFLALIILSLQLGVRLAGWKYFDMTGDIGLGSPGRYFLPYLVSHLCLIYVGIGTIFFYLKAQKYFKYFLATGAILMIYLSLNSIFNYLLYRYYLL